MTPISCAASTAYLSVCPFAHLQNGTNRTHLVAALLVDTRVTTCKVLRTAQARAEHGAPSTEHRVRPPPASASARPACPRCVGHSLPGSCQPPPPPHMLFCTALVFGPGNACGLWWQNRGALGRRPHRCAPAWVGVEAEPCVLCPQTSPAGHLSTVRAGGASPHLAPPPPPSGLGLGLLRARPLPGASGSATLWGTGWVLPRWP